MTPTAYAMLRHQWGLSHRELAALLGVEPQTSRLWASNSPRGGPDERAIKMIRLIEALGVDRARRILSVSQRGDKIETV